MVVLDIRAGLGNGGRGRYKEREKEMEMEMERKRRFGCCAASTGSHYWAPDVTTAHELVGWTAIGVVPKGGGEVAPEEEENVRAIGGHATCQTFGSLAYFFFVLSPSLVFPLDDPSPPTRRRE